MFGLLSKSVALLAALHASVALASPVNAMDLEKRGSGYVNAVYFTNWFVSPTFPRTLYRLPPLY